MSTRTVLLAAAVVAVAALPGCSSPLRDVDASPAASVPSADPTGPVPGLTPSAPPASPDPAAASPADAAPVLTLQGDGLGLLTEDDSPAPLLFGTATVAEVQQEVAAAIGDPTGAPLACPQGPRTGLTADGFTALLDGDLLVGWTDRGAPDRTTTTADGTGVGSTLADLQSAVPDVQVQADGAFTSAGGLSGRAGAPDPAALVTELSAGQTCPGAG